MLDDIRNHDPGATEREREWMDTSPVEVALRVMILACVSIAIGVAASQSPEMELRPMITVANAAAGPRPESSARRTPVNAGGERDASGDRP
jgi:hypothetical protein